MLTLISHHASDILTTCGIAPVHAARGLAFRAIARAAVPPFPPLPHAFDPGFPSSRSYARTDDGHVALGQTDYCLSAPPSSLISLHLFITSRITHCSGPLFAYHVAAFHIPQDIPFRAFPLIRILGIARLELHAHIPRYPHTGPRWRPLASSLSFLEESLAIFLVSRTHRIASFVAHRFLFTPLSLTHSHQ